VFGLGGAEEGGVGGVVGAGVGVGEAEVGDDGEVGLDGFEGGEDGGERAEGAAVPGGVQRS
jgi:hypothetical protein